MNKDELEEDPDYLRAKYDSENTSKDDRIENIEYSLNNIEKGLYFIGVVLILIGMRVFGWI